MKFLFHIHTKNSYDSFLKPQSIVDYAIKNGYGAIAITDHDTLKGSLEAADYVRVNKLDVEIIIGAEYYSNCGDIIGIFLKEEIYENDAEKIIDEIHKQGGIAILPHPFKSHKLTEDILNKIDVIEVFNARCSSEQNLSALQAASKYNKPSLAGNDAHLSKELSLCYNIIDDSSLKVAIMSDKEMYTNYTSKFDILNSQIIKGYKEKNFILIIKMLKSHISILIIQPLRRLFLI